MPFPKAVFDQLALPPKGPTQMLVDGRYWLNRQPGQLHERRHRPSSMQIWRVGGEMFFASVGHIVEGAEGCVGRKPAAGADCLQI